MEEGGEVGEKKRREERREKGGREEGGGKMENLNSFQAFFVMFNIESFREQEEQKDILPCPLHLPRMKIWSPGGGFM